MILVAKLKRNVEAVISAIKEKFTELEVMFENGELKVVAKDPTKGVTTPTIEKIRSLITSIGPGPQLPVKEGTPVGGQGAVYAKTPSPGLAS